MLEQEQANWDDAGKRMKLAKKKVTFVGSHLIKRS
jgi:hypothetical protein